MAAGELVNYLDYVVVVEGQECRVHGRKSLITQRKNEVFLTHWNGKL